MNSVRTSFSVYLGTELQSILAVCTLMLSTFHFEDTTEKLPINMGYYSSGTNLTQAPVTFSRLQQLEMRLHFSLKVPLVVVL